MGELPCEEERGAQPAAGAALAEEKLLPCPVVRVLACGGGPAHEWGQSADHCADPGVEHADALHGRVDASVEHDVAQPQRGSGGVDAKVQARCAEDAAGDCEDDGAARGDEFAHERAVARAAHLRVEARLHEHVECVCRGGAERCSRGEEQQRQGGQRGRGGCSGAEELRDGVERVCGRGGEDDEEGEARFGEREVGEEEAFERGLGCR